MKILKIILLALLVVLVIIQFFPPKKNVDTSDHLAVFLAETNPPASVRTTLEHACYDCHSNNTEYPWYSHVAPVSFWLANHIEGGKHHLNFSDWASYDLKRKDHKMDEFVEMIEKGYMPLDSYTWMHEDAKLSKEQAQELIDWGKKVRQGYQLDLQPGAGPQ